MKRKKHPGPRHGESHHLPMEQVAALLRVDPRTGLDSAEVVKRREEYGPNRLTPRKRISEFTRFLLQFNQPLVYILLVAVGVTFVLGEYVDAAVILGVVLANAVIGYIQEAKAEGSIEALARSVKTMATVRRGGGKSQISSEDLVPGDVVLVQSGDKVPADLRLFEVRNLQVDESSLTGESAPVPKKVDLLTQHTALADRVNQAYAGTLVTYGQAEGVVWATGDATETGRLARLIEEAVDLSTPLTQKIAQFSRLLLVVILVLSALTFAVGVWRGEKPGDMFMAAVALAVGAIPEGLPAAVTITLAIGVNRMARRNVIIRKLPAVETLGSTTIICSDKTGTLTQNQMTVRAVYAGGQKAEVTGAGFDPQGRLEVDGQAINMADHAALRECLKAGLLCNDAQIARHDGRVEIQGDPTEAALIVSAEKAGLLGGDLAGSHPRIDVIPFESELQYMATLHERRGDEAGRVIYKKGAVERLLERCDRMLMADGREVLLDADGVRRVADELAAGGMRVLGFARRHVAPDQHKVRHEHVAEGLTFLGLQGMIDPPRPEAIDAVRKCQQAGISVKMITGDHLLTARAVAGQLGLIKPGGKGDDHAVSGQKLEHVSDADLPALAEHAAVFARVTPEQKLRLVRALQTRGHVVAMTGDGVNDAPALKQADIGIAMGVTGTDVAKGAADMVLTDDNFASIEAAVEEGRGVFDNLTKFIVWTLPTNVGEAIILLVAILIGVTTPALPVQLLWVNMTTAICLGLMLVFEPKEKDLMLRPPREPGSPIMTLPLFMRTGLVSLVMLLGAHLLFMWKYHAEGDTIDEARTVVINVIVVVECFYLLNCRSLTHSVLHVGLLSNPYIWQGIAATILLQLGFTYLPVMNRLFHTAPIDLIDWAHIVAVGMIAGVLVGVEKWVRFGRGGDTHATASA